MRFFLLTKLLRKQNYIHFSVGAELVQAGLAVYGNVEVEQIEDSLITGPPCKQYNNFLYSTRNLSPFTKP